MDDRTRRALMTLLYILLAAWFVYAAFTEATGKWVTFPVSDEKEAAPSPGEEEAPLQTEVTTEEENNG